MSGRKGQRQQMFHPVRTSDGISSLENEWRDGCDTLPIKPAALQTGNYDHLNQTEHTEPTKKNVQNSLDAKTCTLAIITADAAVDKAGGNHNSHEVYVSFSSSLSHTHHMS